MEASSKVLRLDCLPTRTVGAICQLAITDTSACFLGKFNLSSNQVVSERLRLFNNGFRVDTAHHMKTSTTKFVGHKHVH